LANVDDTIEQKIIVSSIIRSNYYDKSKINIDKYELIENSDLLLKIKMKLRNSKDLTCNLTEEENEYNYVKTINKSLKIKSRDNYNQLKDIHENFIENPDIYFLKKGVWINWCNFLGYDTTKFIQTKQKWIEFCKEKEIKTSDDYKKLTLIYEELPIDPEDFYNNFSTISNELSFIIPKNKRR